MRTSPHKLNPKSKLSLRILNFNLSMSTSSPVDPIFLPTRQIMEHSNDQLSETCTEESQQEDTNDLVATQTLGYERRGQATNRSMSTLNAGSRLMDVKRLFTSFARFGHRSVSSPGAGGPTNNEFPESGSLSGSASSASDLLPTPPASPGNLDVALAEISADESDTLDKEPLELMKIKEGKKPERPICYNTLIEDLAPVRQDRVLNNSNAENLANRNTEEEEWIGLEYTLELSSRERNPSDAQPTSAGEHSKSRESWAAIRRGRVNPYYEDEDYYRWRNWHRYLDKLDESRKHRIGLEYKERSKVLAWYYVQEMTTRRVMYQQLNHYGMAPTDVRERLKILSSRRPDPYYPPKKHNFVWVIKRSRSVASLHELLGPSERSRMYAIARE